MAKTTKQSKTETTASEISNTEIQNVEKKQRKNKKNTIVIPGQGVFSSGSVLSPEDKNIYTSEQAYPDEVGYSSTPEDKDYPAPIDENQPFNLTEEEKEIKYKELDGRIADLNKEANERLYKFEGLEAVKTFLSVLGMNVKWKGPECKAVYHIHTKLKNIQSELQKTKGTEWFLNATELYTAYHLLQLIEGKGSDLALKIYPTYMLIESVIPQANAYHDEVNKQINELNMEKMAIQLNTTMEQVRLIHSQQG